MKTNKLSKFLKEKRTDAGLSQIDVAKDLGYGSAQFVSNWERGLSVPPISTMKRLVKLYKFAVAEIYSIVLDEVVAFETAKIRKAFGKGSK